MKHTHTHTHTQTHTAHARATLCISVRATHAKRDERVSMHREARKKTLSPVKKHARIKHKKRPHGPPFLNTGSMKGRLRPRFSRWCKTAPTAEMAPSAHIMSLSAHAMQRRKERVSFSRPHVLLCVCLCVCVCVCVCVCCLRPPCCSNNREREREREKACAGTVGRRKPLYPARFF